jgi:hypothetical protein
MMNVVVSMTTLGVSDKTSSADQLFVCFSISRDVCFCFDVQFFPETLEKDFSFFCHTAPDDDALRDFKNSILVALYFFPK